LKYIRSILGFIGRRSPVTIVVAAIVLVSVIGILDYYLGQNFSSALFFVIPVAGVVWFVGDRPAIAISVLSAFSLFATDFAFRTGQHEVLMAWNAIFPFFFFILLVVLISMLKNALSREELLARTDPLTGLFNRRYFGVLAENEIVSSRRYDHPVSFAYIDVDNFKRVNDTRGHEAGDEVLCVLGSVFRKNLRATDRLARFGGDEFAILLPEARAEAAASALGSCVRMSPRPRRSAAGR
jgi:GGDEF domain-containing protein